MKQSNFFNCLKTKVSIVSFFIEFDIHCELNVVPIVLFFSEWAGCLDLTQSRGEKADYFDMKFKGLHDPTTLRRSA